VLPLNYFLRFVSLLAADLGDATALLPLIIGLETRCGTELSPKC